MSNFVTWVRRNRRKLAVGGAVIGGLYVLGKVAETQYVRYRETENRRLLERLRKENHFTATESTCVVTLTALFPVLRKMISRHLDTDAITTQLKENPSMDTGEKLRLWGRLKVISVTRCLVLVIGGVYLCVMLRIQLNILAGFLYHHQENASLQPNNNIKYGTISQQIQEKFLSINNHFVQHGLASLCTVVSDVVGTLVDNIELHQQLCLSELEGLLNRGFEKLKLLQEDDNILRNPGAFFLPSTDLFLHDVALCEKEELKKMFAETLDVIECEDSVNTVNKLCREGLSHVMDSVGDHFSALSPNTDLDTINQDKNNLHDSGFVSPVNVTMPFAKLIPILSSLTEIDEDEEDVWLSHLSINPNVKTLGANVFESFSAMSPEPGPRTQGWGEWISGAAESLMARLNESPVIRNSS